MVDGNKIGTITMTIELSQEVAALATTAAMTLGFKSVAAFVEQAVVEKASGTPATQISVDDSEAWIEKLHAIAERHESTGRPVDDSRDSIYRAL